MHGDDAMDFPPISHLQDRLEHGPPGPVRAMGFLKQLQRASLAFRLRQPLVVCLDHRRLVVEGMDLLVLGIRGLAAVPDPVLHGCRWMFGSSWHGRKEDVGPARPLVGGAEKRCRGRDYAARAYEMHWL